ncbi:MAG: hypothetical protein U0869_10190 [Chloroflexota bacterium]
MVRSSTRLGPLMEVPLLAAGAEVVFATTVRLGLGVPPDPRVTLGFGAALGLALMIQERRRVRRPGSGTHRFPDAR